MVVTVEGLYATFTYFIKLLKYIVSVVDTLKFIATNSKLAILV